MPEWLDDLLEGATKYEPLIKTGIAAASTYLSYEDQKKKNKLQQQAYNDYMAQVGQAGDEARAAIDINYTPMTVSGVPTTKADVTDFTAVAARGGLMNLPNRQRKRYFAGTGEEDVMEIEEESITPFGLQQETGIDLTGEQVKYETGNSRQDAWGVWNSGAINQEIYEFDFEIFFDSGDWMDRLRGQAPATGNMQMASSGLGINPKILAEWEADGGASGPYKTPEEYYEAYYGDMEMVATGGIIGLRHGGRPGYAEDGFVTADVEEVVSEVPQSQKNLIEGNQMAEDAMNKIMYKFMEKFPGIDSSEMSIEDMIAMLQAEGVWGTEGAGIMDISAGMDMITPESVSRDTQRFARGDTQWGDIPMAQGGRPGYRFGDEVIADQEAIVKTPNEEVVINDMEEIQGQTAGPDWYIKRVEHLEFLGYDYDEASRIAFSDDEYYAIVGGNAKGGLPKRVRKAPGGIMNLGGLEKDYRTTGGFVPIGAYEKKDDVPARLSKNEFVMTADAVRAAGGGSINKGAQLMYDTMKHLEAQPQAQRMTV